ncbi:acyl-CoA dehydrogenase [Marivirga harenae]|uniref:acyl-CoA dehydrogenase family protein n=1 Tax=Marivirga harenae TaxID=2010992 RepID=UPI0026E04432|nr:acyl-CoA dehydrogenase [Marivirga harenae]WKV12170.1 acyl-CoA dehydrogenase [Marivirga harenae]|tara:strand:- start:301942 stop:304236 length:2295 start_codon:yes stop_codon:yes gene_type:complete
MLQSDLLSKNPNLYIFLPFYFTLWEDFNLSEADIQIMKKLIKSQLWLEKAEVELLEQNLNPNQKPSAQELKSWKNQIQFIKPRNLKNLTTLGMQLVLAHQNGNELKISEQNKKAFQNTEKELGLIFNEAAYRFEDSHSTITSEQQSKSSFDPKLMQEVLDGSKIELIQKVKETLAKADFAYHHHEKIADQRQQVLEWCKLLAKEGYGSWAFPREFGGRADMEGYFTIMETLSYHDLSMVIKFGVQFGLWGMSIYFLGTEKHHQKYLKDIGTLELPGCFAMTETNHGSNVRGIETTATYNHQNQTFTIHTPHQNARKEYIGNAALHGQKATVFAKLIIDGDDFGVNAFVVPLRDKKGEMHPGVEIEDCGYKMGLNGVDNGLIAFNKVEIPKADMLDQFASVDEEGKFQSSISSDNKRFFTMLGTLVGGRIGIPRSGLSAAKSGLTIAIRYGNNRRQFGPEGGEEVPILNYRMHQRRLMPLLAKSYALHFALKYLTNRFLTRTQEEGQEIEALAAGMKAYGTWFTTASLQECREACGGKGYLSENRIDDLKNDTDVYTTFEGDNTVLMQLVAKSRLTEFKREMGDMNFITIFNYLSNQAKTSFTEKNPIVVRSTDETHLLDFDFHINAFKYRERAIVASAGQRIKKLVDVGMDSFDAVNVAQHHLVNVGQSYIERKVLERFQLAVETTQNAACKKALKQLCQLYALHTIEQNKGWYLEQGYMEGVKTKAIRKMVNQLCWDIRQDAVALTDAFGIPDNLLAAPIAAP